MTTPLYVWTFSDDTPGETQSWGRRVRQKSGRNNKCNQRLLWNKDTQGWMRQQDGEKEKGQIWELAFVHAQTYMHIGKHTQACVQARTHVRTCQRIRVVQHFIHNHTIKTLPVSDTTHTSASTFFCDFFPSRWYSPLTKVTYKSFRRSPGEEERRRMREIYMWERERKGDQIGQVLTSFAWSWVASQRHVQENSRKAIFDPAGRQR